MYGPSFLQALYGLSRHLHTLVLHTPHGYLFHLITVSENDISKQGTSTKRKQE